MHARTRAPGITNDDARARRVRALRQRRPAPLYRSSDVSRGWKCMMRMTRARSRTEHWHQHDEVPALAVGVAFGRGAWIHSSGSSGLHSKWCTYGVRLTQTPAPVHVSGPCVAYALTNVDSAWDLGCTAFITW